MKIKYTEQNIYTEILVDGIEVCFSIQNAIKAFNPNYKIEFHTHLTPEKVLMSLYQK